MGDVNVIGYQVSFEVVVHSGYNIVFKVFEGIGIFKVFRCETA